MQNWTSAQSKAINSKGSVLVSASAGTGKTAVLTEKVVNTIKTEGIGIDEMIIMTFSSAAANQMKERIKNRIREIIDDPNTDRITKNLLWKQLRKFSDSHIQTIHAFCNELIKKYFYIVGLDPNIRVADNFDVAILKNNAIKEVMSMEYQILDNDFISLDGMIDDTESIEDVIINSYNKIVSFIDYKEWLKDAIEKYNIKGNDIPDFIRNMVLADFNKAIDNYEKAIRLIKQENNQKLDKILEIFQIDWQIIFDIRNGIENGDAKYLGEITSFLEDFGATVRFPNGDYDLIKSLRNDARDLILTKYKKVKFDFNLQIERIKAMYPLLLKFYSIFSRFDEKYIAMKKENHIIDFNDMEKYAYQILKDDNIAADCKISYRKVFIDEYQDTNPIQEAIIDRISTNNNLFCVGDLKQSIYRFRSSDPTLFLQRSEKYSMNMSLGSIISLNNNFRSSQNILDCSNDVFNNITSASSEINYTEDDQLVHGRIDDNSVNPVEIQLISDSFKGNDNLTMEEIEIYNMVKIIKDNIGKDIYDIETGTYRPTEYKDIVILCRKLTGLTDYIAQIFSSNNIPFVIERSGELFDTTEIQILMNIIGLINNPKDDLKLISLMHLGLFGFFDDDIIEIRTKLNNSYYEYMKSLNNESELSLKCNKLFSFLDDCREKQKYISLTAIIDYIIAELHINDIFAIMRNGTQRVANIKEFQKHVHDFENKYNDKLFGFEQYINNIINSEVSVGEAIVNYDNNSVKITTIHKSKGLEFPIVILGFAGKSFNRMDKRANIVIDKDGGIGVRYYSHEKKEKGKCMLRTYIENVIDDKNIEEEMRLLYVAMTRAKEKLYIQGVTSDGTDYSTLSESTSFLNWIMYTFTSCNLSGHWNAMDIDYEDLKPFILSDAIECDLSYMENRFNVYLDVEEKSNISFEDYVPLVLSASIGLKKKKISESLLTVPDFLKSDTDPMYLGTIAHEFLKYVNFKNCETLNGLLEEKKNIKEKGFMSDEDIENVNIEKIFKFFQSSLGKFIISSDEYMREKYINIIKNATEMGYLESNDILVRCILDLICKKDGKYYLIDYKTDTLENPSDLESVKNKALTHKSQLDLYKSALKSAYDIDIEKSYIAFINYGISYEV